MKYIIESANGLLTATYIYLNGKFEQISIEGEVTENVRIPITPDERSFVEWAKTTYVGELKERLKIHPLVAPTFEEFWEAYTPIAKPSYEGKNPDRGRAEKRWVILSDKDKTEACFYLKKYMKTVKPYSWKSAMEGKAYLNAKEWKQNS
jgi:hypothetical protein